MHLNDFTLTKAAFYLRNGCDLAEKRKLCILAYGVSWSMCVGISERPEPVCSREENILRQNKSQTVRAEEEPERWAGARGTGHHKALTDTSPASSKCPCVQSDHDER